MSSRSSLHRMKQLTTPMIMMRDKMIMLGRSERKTMQFFKGNNKEIIDVYIA